MNFLALSIGSAIILLYTLLVIYDLPYNGLNWNITNNSSLLSSVTKKTSKLPPVYIITPTYPRVVQLSELTRMAYVLQVNFIISKKKKNFFKLYFSEYKFLECEKNPLDCGR